MNNLKHILLLTLLLIAGYNAKSQHDNQQTNPDIPEIKSYVNDYADILTEKEEGQLTVLLRSLEDSIGSQLVILSIDSLSGHTIKEFSLQIASIAKIGRANYDDGILITFARYDRQVRIEVGYGLEQIIRDEIAKKIIDSTMIPEFRNGDFYAGLRKGSEEIIHLICSNPELVGKR
ncbi:TPM domain-containing protein [Mangrovivirga cuniculi]|uniref:TPM domain-containing protein n=1 Tax=Mangrovivirga cuniculi TaxID=2715131 RepID=A0A4D7JVE9_9BACT|nr:TPM domain-containing protein [Mangrovivirga cuniculi]QCK16532.1 hypothetical protein DCC35_18245 [Mangrovivirga cuniculi]